MTQHMIISHEGEFKEHFHCVACPSTLGWEAEQSSLAQAPYFYSEEHARDEGWAEIAAGMWVCPECLTRKENPNEDNS